MEALGALERAAAVRAQWRRSQEWEHRSPVLSCIPRGAWEHRSDEAIASIVAAARIAAWVPPVMTLCAPAAWRAVEWWVRVLVLPLLSHVGFALLARLALGLSPRWRARGWRRTAWLSERLWVPLSPFLLLGILAWSAARLVRSAREDPTVYTATLVLVWRNLLPLLRAAAVAMSVCVAWDALYERAAVWPLRRRLAMVATGLAPLALVGTADGVLWHFSVPPSSWGTVLAEVVCHAATWGVLAPLATADAARVSRRAFSLLLRRGWSLRRVVADRDALLYATLLAGRLALLLLIPRVAAVWVLGRALGWPTVDAAVHAGGAAVVLASSVGLPALLWGAAASGGRGLSLDRVLLVGFFICGLALTGVVGMIGAHAVRARAPARVHSGAGVFCSSVCPAV